MPSLRTSGMPFAQFKSGKARFSRGA
jgi:hypothetical protein